MIFIIIIIFVIFCVNLYCVSALRCLRFLEYIYIYSIQNLLHIDAMALSCYHQSFLSECISADILLSVWSFYSITFTVQNILF